MTATWQAHAAAPSADEARRLLASGLRACRHCQPDRQLRILD
nr:DUF6233 domain-containing protein [Streptomyces griseus]